jgi:Glycosyltransferases involved in cell wall biogenesis
MAKGVINLSVIIPCYNLENHIQPMLDSLKSQKLGRFKVEYIFVMNNCTDRTEEIVRGSGLKNTKVLQCEEQGCGCARNVGLENCTGEYVWFMDGDDWLLAEDAIATVLTNVYADDMNIVHIAYESRFSNYFSMVWQYCMKRDLIGDKRFRKTQPCEDDEFMLHILSLVGLRRETFMNMTCILRPLYHYEYLREGSNMYRYFHGEKI